MRAVWKSSLVVSFLIFLSNQGFAQNQGLAQTVEDDIVYSASQTLNEIMRIPARGIPRSLLKQAHGIAIIPDLLKGGFIVGVRHGKGVVIAKNKNGDWQGPYFVKLTGGSVGFQAGVQATDVVLVFMSQKSVTGLMRGKFTIGGDVSVAAGPIGRQAAAATDGKLRAEILSYSRSRGLFAGVSIDGAVLSPDQRSTNAYYAPRPGQPQGTVPASATKLMQQVLAYTGNAAPNPENPPKVQPEVTPQQQEQILRGQLATASLKLQSVLDKQWQQYLALPPQVYNPNVPLPNGALKGYLDRFNSIAAEPRYRALTNRPEFRETHALLARMVSLQANQNAGKLKLPPPPGESR